MILDHLEPKALMGFFEDICAIPHGSGNTKGISDYCVNFARERGLEYFQDALNNVIIIKPAAPGYEASPAVMLQGHLDMVCAKDAETTIDFMNDGLDLATDGKYIFARGTSLGGDDGFAVAMMLALLDSRDIPHPRLEAVFTVDEETGMYGAAGIDLSALKARTMINLDSEEEGVFTVGCAGGVRANCLFPAHRENVRLTPLEIVISGLTGGHSGQEIDKGRGNANILMGRILNALTAVGGVRLVRLSGGSFDNAIPVECSACIAVDSALAPEMAKIVDETAGLLKAEHRLSDPGFTVACSAAPEAPLTAVDLPCSLAIIDALVLFPNGIQAMSLDIPGLVQTSLNLGILRLEDDGMHASFSLRSSVGSQKQALEIKLDRLCRRLGGSVSFAGSYPAWEYRADSPLRELMVSVYEKQYGKKPEVVTIHAGLECGLLSEKLPGLDCVSCGPDMKDIHTCGEKLDIASVKRLWDFILEVLARMK